MKIYHTETQEDYDALMAELEAKGIEWANGNEMTAGIEEWKAYGSRTCVRVEGTDAFYCEKAYYTSAYHDVQIIKYKAKVDEKMKFTKENVGKLFNEHDKYICFSLDDLQDEILKLDDTPEKVVVPKCFDEWFKEIEAIYSIPDSAKTFALWKLCRQGFGHGYEDVHGKKIPYETDLGEWLFKNKMLAIDAVLNGYTIEPDTVTEQRYTVVIADRYLVQLFIGRTDYRFVEFDELCAWKPSAFQLTEAEIKAIDERYWTFAVPVKVGKE